VEYWLTSFSYYDGLDLWTQIERVIFNPGNEAKLQQLGVILTVPSMTQLELNREDYSTYGQGQILTDMGRQYRPNKEDD
jgi:hypothetical protein